MDKFTGKQAEDNFELWFTDFEEPTSAYGWSDDQKAGWFSWFISGPAKATWQRTLTTEQKTSWETIVKTFRRQYGIHLDPCVAYQRCHELQYEMYGSAQGLLNAMRNFQRMAPEKLSDNILETILWNKVPVELQQEVKEISGSVQELLQKLLRAESVLAERKRRTSQPRSVNRENHNPRHRAGETQQAAGTTEKTDTGTNRRTPQQHFGVNQVFRTPNVTIVTKRGILPRIAQYLSPPSRRVAIDSSTDPEQDDLWMRTVTSETKEPMDTHLATRGLTYKVDVVVDGVKTRALLDPGVQVSLARRQLLPAIKEKNNWTKEQCQSR